MKPIFDEYSLKRNPTFTDEMDKDMRGLSF